MAALGLPLAGCAGDGNGRTADVIHRLLVAATGDDAGTLEGFPGKLPRGLPAVPPRYPGADLILSARRPSPTTSEAGPPAPGAEPPQPVLYFIVLDTGDPRNDVFAFYEEQLDEAPWRLDSSFSTAQLDTLQFSNVDDPDIAGAVSIAGGEDGRTSLLISLQDAGGAAVDEEPPFELPESLPVPKAFPAEVPVYADATITDTAFTRQPGTTSFLLIFLTPDSRDRVIGFYQREFEGNGWTVTEGAAFGVEERIDFRSAGQDVRGEVIASSFARAERYTEVRLRVQLSAPSE
jgi:hypothetical protein